MVAMVVMAETEALEASAERAAKAARESRWGLGVRRRVATVVPEDSADSAVGVAAAQADLVLV
jgi:hypothetical protein